MFWGLIIATGAAGVSIGLWLRVGALIAASMLVAAIGIGTGLARGHVVLAALDVTAALVTLQVGYLLGLMLSCRWRRLR
jgi:hypothetical protein